MDDKPRFVAKTSRIDNSVVPYNGNPYPIQSINVPSVPSFDLDQLNLVELCGQLKESLNEPKPLFIFSSKRRNKKLELEKDRVRTILETIESVRDVNVSLSKARAEILLSQAVSESIIKDYFTERILRDEIQKETHTVTVDSLKDQREAIKDSAQARKLQLEAAEISNLRARAEISALEAKTKAEHAKADLIKYVVDNIDLKDMPQILQTFVVQSIINPHCGGTIPDLDLQNELKEFVKRQAAAKARTDEAEATKKESEAVVSKTTSDKVVLDFEEIKKRK
jgi:hypothetical protein